MVSPSRRKKFFEIFRASDLQKLRQNLQSIRKILRQNHSNAIWILSHFSYMSHMFKKLQKLISMYVPILELGLKMP